MFVTFIVLSTLGLVSAGIAGTASNEVGDGNSYGYGYSGSFSGGDNSAIPIPPIPSFDFSIFANYLETLRKQHEQLLSHIQNNVQQIPNSVVQPNIVTRGKFTPQGSVVGGGGSEGGFGYGGSFSSSGIGDGGAAIASGSIGPQGGYQSAKVFPENPNSPNFETRFGGNNGGGPGFYSVSTFSSSATKNVDGKPKTVQQASTTVNDNGKVSTYTVKNP